MFLVAHNRIYESSDRIAVVNEIKSSISQSYLGLYSFRFPVGVFLLFWSILRRYIFPIISVSLLCVDFWFESSFGSFLLFQFIFCKFVVSYIFILCTQSQGWSRACSIHIIHSQWCNEFWLWLSYKFYADLICVLKQVRCSSLYDVFGCSQSHIWRFR